MKTKAVAAAAIAAALAAAALGVRGLRPARDAVPIPVPEASVAAPQAAAPAPVQALIQAPTGGSPSPQAASGMASPIGADLAKADVVEAVVAVAQPSRAAAPRPRLEPLRGVSNVMDADAHTGAMIANAPEGCPGCAAAQNEMMKAVQAMTGQAQAMAMQAASPKARGPVPTAGGAPPAMDTPQAVMLELSPNSTLEDLRYTVRNVNDKTVNDVQIITPGKTWKLGALAPGQTAEIVAAGPLMQVKVHYVTSPK